MSPFNASVAAPRELLISPQTTDASEKMNSPSNSNSTVETNPSENSLLEEIPPYLEGTEWNNFNPFDGLNSGLAAVVSNNENTLLDLDKADWDNDQQTNRDLLATSSQEPTLLSKETIVSEEFETPFDFNTTYQF